MHKIKPTCLLAVLLSISALLACTIDEEENLLFGLKDSLRAAGKWQSQNGTEGFTFKTDATFTARVGGHTGSGRFHYRETTSKSVFYTDQSVAEFVLTWELGELETKPDKTKSLNVKKRSNGDLYFEYRGKEYTQTG